MTSIGFILAICAHERASSVVVGVAARAAGVAAMAASKAAAARMLRITSFIPTMARSPLKGSGLRALVRWQRKSGYAERSDVHKISRRAVEALGFSGLGSHVRPNSLLVCTRWGTGGHGFR